VVSTEADDQDLVAAAQKGDRQAFQQLYRRYQRKCYAVAHGFLRNEEDALDIVQEAFIKVHRHLPKFEGQSSFYTWLYRITANLCIDRIRREKRHRESEFDDRIRPDEDGQAAELGLLSTPALADPAKALRGAEILRAVEESLGELSTKHRAVIVMRELRHMSYAEMAEAMDCSKGTIMSRLFHARRNMQHLLKQRLDDLPDVTEEPSKSEAGTDESRPSREVSVS
jgi:RNA polymerase sigma-70 factor (ECF subfamily)